MRFIVEEKPRILLLHEGDVVASVVTDAPFELVRQVVGVRGDAEDDGDIQLYCDLRRTCL